MGRIYKKSQYQNGRQAGVLWFVRSISLRRTSAIRFSYSQTGCFLMEALQHCGEMFRQFDLQSAQRK